MYRAIILSTILLLTCTAQAQDNSRVDSAKTDVRIELLEAVYKSKNDEPSLHALILALHNYLIKNCISGMLAKVPVPPSEACLQTSDKALTLAANNPYASCVKFGLESENCTNAFASIKIVMDSFEAQFPPGSEQYNQAHNQKPIVEAAEQAMGAKRSRENRETLLQALEKMIQLSCLSARIELIGKEPVQYQRHILDLCDTASGKALRLDQNNAYAICYREGAISPNCLRAKKLRKPRPPTPAKNEKPASKPENKGFVTF